MRGEREDQSVGAPGRTAAVGAVVPAGRELIRRLTHAARSSTDSACLSKATSGAELGFAWMARVMIFVCRLVGSPFYRFQRFSSHAFVVRG